MAFEHIITVRFNEVDRAGIAFFSRVYEYCHAAFEEMLMAFGSGLSTVFSGENWGMPLVHSEADYRAPMRLGDRLKIVVEVTRLGEKSVTFGYRVLGDDGKLRATVSLVHAIVDLKSFQARAVPNLLLEAFNHFNLVVDPNAGRPSS